MAIPLKADAMLLLIHDVLNQEKLAFFREAYSRLDFGDGRATAGDRAAMVKRNFQLANDSPEHATLTAEVVEVLAHCQEYMSAALPLETSPPLFNRYMPDMAFGQHVDNAIRIDGDVPLRADISTTIMLSDPDSYEGGDLVIEDTYGERRIRLPAGSMIVYPSASLHRVEPITAGIRDVIVLWTQSMVRHESQRQLLYQLDQSIQSLRKREPNAPEIDRLMSNYHNLLRMWANL